MNFRRLAIVLSIFALGLLVLWAYTAGQRHWRRQAEEDTTTQPQKQPEDTSTPAATTRPATQPNQQATDPGDDADDEAEPEDEPDTAGADRNATTKTAVTRPAVARGGWRFLQAGDVQTRALGSLDADSGYLFELELDNRTAGIRTARLTNYYETVADKRLAEEDPQRYARVLAEERDKPSETRTYHGHYKVLTPLGADDDPRLSMATARVKLKTAQHGTISFNLRNKRWRFAGGDASGRRAVLVLQLGRLLPAETPQTQPYVPYLELRKIYEIAENDYRVGVTLEIENLLTDEHLDNEARRTRAAEDANLPAALGRELSAKQIDALGEEGKSLAVWIDQHGPSGIPREDRRHDSRHTAVGMLDTEAEAVDVGMEPPSDRLKGKKPGERVVVGRSSGTEPILWIGGVNKYFGAMMYLVPEGDEPKLQADSYDAAFYFAAAGEGYQTGTTIGFRSLGGAETVLTARWDTFVGPKRRRMFSGESDLPARDLYATLGFDKTVSTRSCSCAFGWLTRPLMWLLDQFSFVNYGVAIILLVALVRLVLHPLTKKGQVSMMKMQKLAPQMQKLKEKYKDDKETLNREMMKLYKQAGATPILGCLPMLLQMPIWIALFTGLNSAVELRHAAFLPVWITDLAAPDALIGFGRGIEIPLLSLFMSPLYGLNLLPILVALAMLLNVKMNPQAQATGSSDQAKQSKMMMYLMPIMMLLFFYQAPSGLNLYIMTSTFAGVAEQKVIRRHIQQREQEQAQRETTVTMPGKKARSQRPKKPKGPFWHKQG
ncbi:MAG: membrane protein insertase YidC [Phycisphaerae bacterium]|nr:membrane protein insertase YidC [Phycisphaerae bacterium]